MLVGSGRALVRSTTSVSPTSASMVGPGTCPLNPYPGTTWSGAISHSVSAGSSRTFTVFPVPTAFVFIGPSFRPLTGSTEDADLTTRLTPEPEITPDVGGRCDRGCNGWQHAAGRGRP